jgi:hypothetical protein
MSMETTTVGDADSGPYLREASLELDQANAITQELDVGGYDLGSFVLKILDGASPAAFTVALEGVLAGGESAAIAVPAQGATRVAGLSPASPTVSAMGATDPAALSANGAIVQIDLRSFERVRARVSAASSTSGARALILLGAQRGASRARGAA